MWVIFRADFMICDVKEYLDVSKNGPFLDLAWIVQCVRFEVYLLDRAAS